MKQLSDKQKAEGWRVAKFGEMARNICQRVEPTSTDLKVYVGLEHLDSDNLRIIRRGTPDDVKGQKLLVKPGQIIFGKRRAYQRKVAVADFEGICSAHAMVLEAIPEVVVPEYLPFFMQSDMFMERAVAISEGSLSPTIKWKILARQEFPLPPSARQEKMLKVFGKFEDNMFQYSGAINKGNLFLEKLIVDSIFTKNKNDVLIPLHCLVKEIREHFSPNINSPVLPYVGFEHIDSDCIQINNYGCSSDVHSNKLYFQKGDILYGKIRPYLKKTGLVDVDGICSSDIVVLRPLNDSAKNLLSVIIKTDYFSKLATNTASGSKMPRANWSVLSKTMINKTAIEKNEINECVENTLQVIEQAKVNQDKCIAMKSKVVEELFQFH